MLAAYNAMETAVRMLRPGLYKNMEITDIIEKVANIYQVFRYITIRNIREISKG